jgi:hypothetical protein
MFFICEQMLRTVEVPPVNPVCIADVYRVAVFPRTIYITHPKWNSCSVHKREPELTLAGMSNQI